MDDTECTDRLEQPVLLIVRSWVINRERKAESLFYLAEIPSFWKTLSCGGIPQLRATKFMSIQELLRPISPGSICELIFFLSFAKPQRKVFLLFLFKFNLCDFYILCAASYGHFNRTIAKIRVILDPKTEWRRPIFKQGSSQTVSDDGIAYPFFYAISISVVNLNIVMNVLLFGKCATCLSQPIFTRLIRYTLRYLRICYADRS